MASPWEQRRVPRYLQITQTSAHTYCTPPNRIVTLKLGTRASPLKPELCTQQMVSKCLTS